MLKKYPKIILCDVDGTLTDGVRHMRDDGAESKAFYVPDGTALLAVKKMGIKTGIITADHRPLIELRAQQLKLDIVELGVHHKLDCVRELVAKHNISMQDVAFIGDDINDYEILREVGFPVCPGDAQVSIKKIDGILVTKAYGGRGAVREMLETFFGEKALLEAFLAR